MVRSAGAAAEALELVENTGTADALYNLGMLYSTGQGVQLDYVQAHKWFNLAAMQGSEEAKSKRAELAAEMSGNEIAVAQREAREWLSTR